MSDYLFIESKEPFESKDTAQVYGLLKELSRDGHKLSLFLVQNGVFSSRKNAQMNLFSDLLKDNNISIYADDYSLEERGITSEEMASEVKVASMDHLLDLLMADTCKAIWH